MDINMTQIRADVERVNAVRDSSWTPCSKEFGYDRYSKSRDDACAEVGAELGWTPAYQDLVSCFESAWGYAGFDTWSKNYGQ
jgi:hypothetical protein